MTPVYGLTFIFDGLSTAKIKIISLCALCASAVNTHLAEPFHKFNNTCDRMFGYI